MKTDNVRYSREILEQQLSQAMTEIDADQSLTARQKIEKAGLRKDLRALMSHLIMLIGER